MIRWAALLLTVTAFGGLVAWLHSRAGPESRPRCAAEQALLRQLPDQHFSKTPIREVFERLSKDAGVPIRVRWENLEGRNDGQLRPDGTLTAHYRGMTLIDIFCAIQRRTGAEFGWHPAGDRIVVDEWYQLPTVTRLYDFRPLLQGLPEHRPPIADAPLGLNEPLGRGPWESRRERLDRLARYGGSFYWYRIARSNGERMAVTALWAQHASCDSLYSVLLERPSDAVPAESAVLLAALEQPAPEFNGVLTIRDAIAKLLDGRVPYEVDWDSMEAAGMPQDTKVTLSIERRPYLGDELVSLLQRPTLYFTWESRPKLAFSFDGKLLRIVPAQDARRILRGYSLSDSRLRSQGSPWIFENPETRRGISNAQMRIPYCAILDEYMFVYATEDEHWAIRDRIAGSRVPADD